MKWYWWAPAPAMRARLLTRLEVIRTVLRNPLELWGEPSYTLPWIETKFFNQRTLIVNDPDLIRYVLVENAANYEMSQVRRLILRPILRDRLAASPLCDGPVYAADATSGEVVVTEGPYTDTPQRLGGFTIVSVADDEAAKHWAGKIAVGCGWPQEVRRIG